MLALRKTKFELATAAREVRRCMTRMNLANKQLEDFDKPRKRKREKSAQMRDPSMVKKLQKERVGSVKEAGSASAGSKPTANGKA